MNLKLLADCRVKKKDYIYRRYWQNILKVCLFNFRTRKPAWVSTIKVTYVKRATVVDNPSVATTTMNSGVSPSVLYGFPSWSAWLSYYRSGLCLVGCCVQPLSCIAIAFSCNANRRWPDTAREILLLQWALPAFWGVMGCLTTFMTGNLLFGLVSGLDSTEGTQNSIVCEWETTLEGQCQQAQLLSLTHSNGINSVSFILLF